MTNLELKEFRKNLKLTQKEFGDKLGLNATQVKDMEIGRTKIPKSIKMLIKFVFPIEEKKFTDVIDLKKRIADMEIQLNYQQSFKSFDLVEKSFYDSENRKKWLAYATSAKDFYRERELPYFDQDYFNNMLQAVEEMAKQNSK